ncbi:MAG: sulfite exporter TauE/SafE family protein [Pseudomonadota bacterium]|nr:sulfite exporter TauE/SafE family protein [Pseudomonadota bacterium]
MLPAETIIFLLSGAVLAGFAMGLVGFGTGLAALGFWLHVVEPKIAVPLVVICSLATTLFTCGAYSHAISLHRLLPFTIGGLLGLPLGVALLVKLDPGIVKAVIGGFLVAYTLFRLLVLPRLVYTGGGNLADGVIGAVAGILGGIAAIPGPVTITWCGLRGWSKDAQRGVYQPFNQGIILVAFVLYAWEGMATHELWIVSLYCLPASLVGMWVGMKAYKHIDDALFQKIVLWFLLASGAVMVFLNLRGG